MSMHVYYNINKYIHVVPFMIRKLLFLETDASHSVSLGIKIVKILKKVFAYYFVVFYYMH